MHRRRAAIGHLEGDGRSAAGRHGEGVGVLAQNRKHLKFEIARRDDVDHPWAGQPRDKEARSRKALLRDGDHHVARFGAAVAEACRHPAEQRARTLARSASCRCGRRYGSRAARSECRAVRSAGREIGLEIHLGRGFRRVDDVDGKSRARQRKSRQHKQDQQRQDAGKPPLALSRPQLMRSANLPAASWQGMIHQRVDSFSHKAGQRAGDRAIRRRSSGSPAPAPRARTRTCAGARSRPGCAAGRPPPPGAATGGGRRSRA